MSVDVDDGQIRKSFAHRGYGRSRKGVFATKRKGELAAPQHFAHCFAGSFKGGSVIHIRVIKRGAGIDANFNGAPVEFLVVEFHLAGGSENRLWPMFGAFYIADTILKR